VFARAVGYTGKEKLFLNAKQTDTNGSLRSHDATVGATVGATGCATDVATGCADSQVIV